MFVELLLHLNSKHVIYCDNLGATYVSANPFFHSKMKHLGLDYQLFKRMRNVVIYVSPTSPQMTSLWICYKATATPYISEICQQNWSFQLQVNLERVLSPRINTFVI